MIIRWESNEALGVRPKDEELALFSDGSFLVETNQDKKKKPCIICRVLLYPTIGIEGKGRGETGGRTYGET
jgi:hypothetical protein